MQLAIYGAQDIYITGNPQISFFKNVFRRHTNFSIECIEQSLDGEITVNSSTITSTISKAGDLISNMHFDVNLNSDTIAGTSGTYLNWTNNTGHALFESVEVKIGSIEID